MSDTLQGNNIVSYYKNKTCLSILKSLYAYPVPAQERRKVLKVIFNDKAYFDDPCFQTEPLLRLFKNLYHICPIRLYDTLCFIPFHIYYKYITNQVIPQNEFLPRNPHFMDLSRECLIEMTGSRKKDKEQAEALNGNPNNWVWHHVEGLKLVGNNAYCNMVPAEPIFHSQRHIGAVKEYETIKSKKYKT